MLEPQSDSYDDVPYDSCPFPQTHPDRLATTALVLGHRAPSVERCRVLEIGCARGDNLLSLAASLPDATFVGVDKSTRQAEECRTVARELGLSNVTVHNCDVRDLDLEGRRFDFIICHGVFAWVARPVQDRIFEICSRHLAPLGVAYVSYNTYPGWHLRGLIRGLMCYHASKFREPLDRARHARRFLEFLSTSAQDRDGVYGQILRSEFQLLHDKADSYLFHDHLEEINEPLYFHDFASRARAFGLHFLGETDLQSMLEGSLPAEVESALKLLASDPIDLEQYKDFVTNRSFRQTLLCLKEQTPSPAARLHHLPLFHVTSQARPRSDSPDPRSDAQEHFDFPGDRSIASTEPIVKAAMIALGRAWPRAIPYGALRDEACRLLDRAQAEDDDARLGRFLVTAFASGQDFIALSLRPRQFATTLSERPRAYALAAYQARRGPRVASLKHESVALDDFHRWLLLLCDGTRDRAAIAAELAGRHSSGEVEVDGIPLEPPCEQLAAIADRIERQLPRILTMGLLEA